MSWLHVIVSTFNFVEFAFALPWQLGGESVEMEPSEKYGAGHSATTSTTSCKICKYFTFASYFYIHLHFLVLPCIFLFSAEHIEK